MPVGRLGSTLSGGMDSGTVAAVASDILVGSQRGKLPTYSGSLTPDPAHLEAREVDAIAAATTMESIDPTVIFPDTLEEDYARMIAGNEEPFDGHCLLLKAIYMAADTDGHKVILDGAAGDVVLGEGSYHTRLIRQGRLLTALREIAGANRFWGGNTLAKDIFMTFRSALAPEFVKRIRRQRRLPNLDPYFESSPISREFAANIDIVERLQRLEQLFPKDWEPDYAVETCRSIRPNVTAGRSGMPAWPRLPERKPPTRSWTGA